MISESKRTFMSYPMFYDDTIDPYVNRQDRINEF